MEVAGQHFCGRCLQINSQWSVGQHTSHKYLFEFKYLWETWTKMSSDGKLTDEMNYDRVIISHKYLGGKI